MIYSRNSTIYTSHQPSRTIVASWPGVGTADTVYLTQDQREVVVTGSSAIPEGYCWADKVTYRTADDDYIRVAPEQGAIGPKGSVGPQKPERPRPRTPYRPMRAPVFKQVMRPEFHARSHPRF